MNKIQTLERQSDSQVVLPRPARPVSFTGLMTLYESNYIRLGWLLPKLPAQGTRLESRVSADFPLQLLVADVARYTTTLVLTYHFRDGAQEISDPDLQVRVYHDAGLVEAMACTNRQRHELLSAFPTGAGSELQQRWTRNMMLNKWLEFCADKGHQFGDT